MPPTGHTMSGSSDRTDRTGPTTCGTVELNMATKRVMSPSTTSSYTTSAWSMLVCGRALGVFSTFTDSAGRVRLAPVGSASPVSGAIGGATVVVVGAAVVVVRFVVAAFESPPPQAETNSASAATTAVV